MGRPTLPGRGVLARIFQARRKMTTARRADILVRSNGHVGGVATTPRNLALRKLLRTRMSALRAVAVEYPG